MLAHAVTGKSLRRIRRRVFGTTYVVCLYSKLELLIVLSCYASAYGSLFVCLFVYVCVCVL